MGKGINRMKASLAKFVVLREIVGTKDAYKIYVNFHTRKLIGWEPFDVPKMKDLGLDAPF